MYHFIFDTCLDIKIRPDIPHYLQEFKLSAPVRISIVFLHEENSRTEEWIMNKEKKTKDVGGKDKIEWKCKKEEQCIREKQRENSEVPQKTN